MTDLTLILDRIGKKLVEDVAPKLQGDYAHGHAVMIGLINVMAAEMWDGAADRLQNEIVGLRHLLSAGGAAPDVAPSPSLKISDLSTERDELARNLIILQTRLEARPEDPEAKLLLTKIWAHLLQTALARMPSPPAFGEATD